MLNMDIVRWVACIHYFSLIYFSVLLIRPSFLDTRPFLDSWRHIILLHWWCFEFYTYQCLCSWYLQLVSRTWFTLFSVVNEFLRRMLIQVFESRPLLQGRWRATGYQRGWITVSMIPCRSLDLASDISRRSWRSVAIHQARLGCQYSSH